MGEGSSAPALALLAREGAGDELGAGGRARPAAVHVLVALHFLLLAMGVGALFDTYLLRLGGSKAFVGAMESVRGAVALCVALPVGVLADRRPRHRLLQGSAGVGAIGLAVLAGGIMADNVAWLGVGLAVVAAYTQVLQQLSVVYVSDHWPARVSRRWAGSAPWTQLWLSSGMRGFVASSLCAMRRTPMLPVQHQF